MAIIVSSPLDINAVEQKDGAGIYAYIVASVYVDATDSKDTITARVAIPPITGTMSATERPDSFGHVLFWSASISSSNTSRFPYRSYYWSSNTLRSFYSSDLALQYRVSLVYKSSLSVTDNSINHAEFFYKGTGDNRDKASVSVKIDDATTSFEITEPGDGTFVYLNATIDAFLQDQTEAPDVVEFVGDLNDFLTLEATDPQDTANLQQETRECNFTLIEASDASAAIIEILGFADIQATEQADVVDMSPNALWAEKQTVPQTTWEKVA